MVGVLDVVGSTNIAMKKGFEQNGYHVEDFNYRTELLNRGHNGMHEYFDGIINTRRFDLIVFCKTNQMNPVFLDIAKCSGPTWYWFMDPMNTAKQMHASDYAQNATFASATASDVYERFALINKNSYHMFEGYDPDVYFYEDMRKIRDVVFIGNATIPRIMAIKELKEAGVEITIFGHGWPMGMHPCPSVFGEDERIEINQSKTVLNLCQDEVLFSDRVTKALACGAKIISQPCKDLFDIDTFGLKSWVGMFTNAKQFIQVNETLDLSGREEQIANVTKTVSSWKNVCKDILGKVEEYNERNVR